MGRAEKVRAPRPSRVKIIKKLPHVKLGFQRTTFSPSGQSESEVIPLSQHWGLLASDLPSALPSALGKIRNSPGGPRYSQPELAKESQIVKGVRLSSTGSTQIPDRANPSFPGGTSVWARPGLSLQITSRGQRKQAAED